MLRTVEQYNVRLVEKKKMVTEQKAHVMSKYDDLISDMDGFLANMAESSATMAERNFQSRKRDFKRFLERWGTSSWRLDSDHKCDRDRMTKEFHAFVSEWVTVFAECSADPIGVPNLVASEADLKQCANAGEMCKLVLDRLERTEVRFVTVQRSKDAEDVQHFKRVLASHSDSGRPVLMDEQQDLEDQPRDPERQQPQAPRQRAADAAAAPDDGRGGAAKGARQRRCGGCCCSWLRLGRFGCGYTAEKPEARVPGRLSCGCLQVAFLSDDHLRIVACAIWAALVLALSAHGVVAGRASAEGLLYLLALSAHVAALVVVLTQFEDIDIVQQLLRECLELEAESSRVKERRQEMRHFWDQVQNVSEIWAHRTAPRLDLLKEVCDQLEDATAADLLPYLGNVNRQLGDL